MGYSSRKAQCTSTLSSISGMAFLDLCLKAWWISVSSSLKVLLFRSLALAFQPPIPYCFKIWQLYVCCRPLLLAGFCLLSTPRHESFHFAFLSQPAASCTVLRTQLMSHGKIGFVFGAPLVSNPSNQFYTTAKSSASFFFLKNISSSWTKSDPQLTPRTNKYPPLPQPPRKKQPVLLSIPTKSFSFSGDLFNLVITTFTNLQFL